MPNTAVKITSVSIPKPIHRRMIAALPRWGDRSKLLSHLLERWLDGEIFVSQTIIRSRPLAQQAGTNDVVSNTTS